MFRDIRGFTRLAETLPPSEAVALLSDDHARMVDAIFRHGGTIDKFIGDGVNVASRIRDACNSLDEPFLVSEALKARLPADTPRRPLRVHRVKGR